MIVCLAQFADPRIVSHCHLPSNSGLQDDNYSKPCYDKFFATFGLLLYLPGGHLLMTLQNEAKPLLEYLSIKK